MKNEILSLLPPDFPWGESVHYLESVDSTNSYAKGLAKAGAPHGTAVIAKAQTGGRGRMGRSFHSPDGGLYILRQMGVGLDAKPRHRIPDDRYIQLSHGIPSFFKR